ncbi:MAG: hypothetical protein ABH808_02300 [Candidatus Kuenenbacteria bacterium]
MNEERKKLILWVSVFLITVIIVIVWGFSLKQNFSSLKIKSQQKKEIDPKNLEIKKNLEELKKSIENFKQGFSDVKTNLEKENTLLNNDPDDYRSPVWRDKANLTGQVKTEEQKNTKLFPEQIEKFKEKIKEAVNNEL